MFLLACLGSTAGMMAFTLQQTICISTCPPDYPYFPQVKVGTASLAWSFYIGWVGSGKYSQNIFEECNKSSSKVHRILKF